MLWLRKEKEQHKRLSKMKSSRSISKKRQWTQLICYNGKRRIGNVPLSITNYMRWCAKEGNGTVILANYGLLHAPWHHSLLVLPRRLLLHELLKWHYFELIFLLIGWVLKLFKSPYSFTFLLVYVFVKNKIEINFWENGMLNLE